MVLDEAEGPVHDRPGGHDPLELVGPQLFEPAQGRVPVPLTSAVRDLGSAKAFALVGERLRLSHDTRASFAAKAKKWFPAGP